MTDVRRTATRSAGRSLARRWRQAGGAAAAVAAAALLAPSAALAATGGTGTAGQPAAVTPGALLAWGNGSSLGTGDSTNSSVLPHDSLLPIPSLKDKFVTQLQGGCNTAVALASTGDVLTWGDGTAGELGNGTNSFSAAPVPVSFPGTPKITSVAAGCTYILALTADGNVLAWGDNGAGELGNGQPGKNQNRPVPVEFPNGVRVTAISAGLDFAMALTSTGQLYAWGDDGAGELGDGGGHQLRGKPVLVHLPRNVRATSVSAGGNHTLAMTNAGLVSWGLNDHGQLGNGTHRQLSTPFPVFLPRGTHVTRRSAPAMGTAWSWWATAAACWPGATTSWGNSATAPPPTGPTQSPSSCTSTPGQG